jgi:hypothetical protein
VTANAVLANPTVQATAASSVATGGLNAGTYYANYTFVDAFGETLAAAAGESAQFTVTGTTQLWTVTLPALPTRAKAINLYVTPANGASGTELLYATGITATTFGCSYALPTDQPTAGLPATNTTGAYAARTIYALTTKANSELDLERMVEVLSSIVSGYPMPAASIYHQIDHYWGVVSLWAQAWKEINTLVVSKLPSATLSSASTAIGLPLTAGSWVLPAS